MQLCMNSKRILLLTVGYDGLRKGSYGVVGTVGAVGDVIGSLNVSGEDATQVFNSIKNGLEDSRHSP